MFTNQLFEKAQMRYNCAIGTIEEMLAVAGKVDQDFISNLHNDFDILVQYTLLKIVVAKGSLSQNESKFIDDITSEYDVLFLFDSYEDIDYDWEYVATYMGFEKAQHLLNRVASRANEHVNYFLKVLADVHLANPNKNYYDALYKCLFDIALYFDELNDAATEKHVVEQTINECFVEPWKRVQANLK